MTASDKAMTPPLANKQIVTYSANNTEADYYAIDIHYNNLGHPTFTIVNEGKSLITLSLSVPGLHNIANAISSYIAAKHLDLSDISITTGLKAFTGTHRRFQYKGDLGGGVTIVDDYAHHPTEIEATIEATKSMTFGKLWIVFQPPHTYTRTKAFLDEFSVALAKADHVIVMDIYSASREKDLGGDIHSRDLMTKIRDHGTPCDYFESFDEISYHILTKCIPNDLLITMGAGDVYLLGESLLNT